MSVYVLNPPPLWYNNTELFSVVVSILSYWNGELKRSEAFTNTLSRARCLNSKFEHRWSVTISNLKIMNTKRRRSESTRLNENNQLHRKRAFHIIYSKHISTSYTTSTDSRNLDFGIMEITASFVFSHVKTDLTALADDSLRERHGTSNSVQTNVVVLRVLLQEFFTFDCSNRAECFGSLVSDL